MQFMVLGYDGEDQSALERRLAVREAHIALGNQLRDEGKMLYAVAILDSTEKMVGSMIVLEMESRAEVDAWLEQEPYVTGNVWEKIEVVQCKVGPSFLQ